MKERISLTDNGFCPAWDQSCFPTLEELERADRLHKLRVMKGEETCICALPAPETKARFGQAARDFVKAVGKRIWS